MAVETGYSKIVTSGSVFVYDTGDTFNSWKGKPGTNIVASIGYGQGTNTGTYYKTNYGTEIDTIPALGGDTLVNYINIYNDYPNSGNCCISRFNFGSASPLSGNTTYTYQLIYKTPAGENSAFMYRYEYGPGGYILEGGVWSAGNTTNLGNGWKHAWGQFTTNASTTNGYFYMFFYEYAQWYHIQVYSCSITAGTAIYPPRQFIPVNSTRSNTQGLLDISGVGNSINLANVSFDSSAQMVFDGTDDSISVSSFSLNPNTSGFTYESIINSTIANTSYSGWKNLFSFGGGSNFYGILVESDSRGYRLDVPDNSGNRQGVTTNITLAANTNYHIAWSWLNGVFKFYVNGVLQVNSNVGAYPAPNITSMAFGTGINVSNGYWYGLQNMSKVYNRQLTDSEVRSNYNHYKTRFNLP